MIGKLATFVLGGFLWVTAVSAVAGASVYFVATLVLAIPGCIIAAFLILLFSLLN